MAKEYNAGRPSPEDQREAEQGRFHILSSTVVRDEDVAGLKAMIGAIERQDGQAAPWGPASFAGPRHGPTGTSCTSTAGGTDFDCLDTP